MKIFIPRRFTPLEIPLSYLSLLEQQNILRRLEHGTTNTPLEITFQLIVLLKEAQ